MNIMAEVRPAMAGALMTLDDYHNIECDIIITSGHLEKGVMFYCTQVSWLRLM